MLLEADEHARQEFLVSHRVALQTVGYDIVDILDENHVGTQVVQVLDERTVTAGTEQDATAVVAEKLVLGRHGHSVGRGLLLREGNVVAHAVLAGILLGLLLNQLLEKRAVLRRNGEVYRDGFVGILRIQGPFDQMFLERRARALGVTVELQEAFGQLAVIQTVLSQQGADDVLIPPGLDQSVDTCVAALRARDIQVLEKREVMNVLEKVFLEVRLRDIVRRIGESEQIFEHAAGCSRSGYELKHLAAFAHISVPRRRIGCALLVRRHKDTLVHRSGRTQLQIGEAGLETGQLFA